MEGNRGSDNRSKKNGSHREEIAPEVEILGDEIGKGAIAEGISVKEGVIGDGGEDEERPSRDGEGPERKIGIPAESFFDVEDVGTNGGQKAKEEEHRANGFAR